jgi:predicted amino acid racemase
LHVFDPAAPEVPAVVYVSEVSHLDGDDAYVLGGGYYADKVLGEYQLSAVVGRDPNALETVLPMDVIPDGAISYYAILRGAASAGIKVGDSVVCCFRPQTFVTRARTQAVKNLHSTSAPTFAERYDEEARLVEGVG